MIVERGSNRIWSEAPVKPLFFEKREEEGIKYWVPLKKPFESWKVNPFRLSFGPT